MASLAYDGKGILREVVFVGRGRIGHGLGNMLCELRTQVSRAVRSRNPDGGQPAGVLAS